MRFPRSKDYKATQKYELLQFIWASAPGKCNVFSIMK